MGWFDWLPPLTKRSAMNNLVDPNFRASVQMYTPGQPVWMPKNYSSFVREGYKKNPTVYACINKIAGAAAGIKWKLYTDKSMEKEITKHPFLDLWNSPNPNMKGPGSLVEAVFGFWLMSGNSYLWVYRNSPNQPPAALWPIRPDRMKAVVGKQGISGWVYGYGTTDAQDFEFDDIMHLKFPAYDDDVYGLSPIEVASYYVDQINESMAWNTSLMQNMGRPASVFFTKGYLTEEQRNQVRQELHRKYSGKRNAGMPLILEADMSWQNMSLKPAELDWLESRERNSRDIASVLGIASELIGDSQNKTYSNMAEARQALYTENVLPKMDIVRDYLNSWLLPMWPDLTDAYWTYDTQDIEALSDLFQSAEDAKHNRAREDWMAGGITLNEYREAIGEKPIDAGDCLRFGGVIVSVDSLDTYADQSLTEPAAPPMPQAEPLNIQGANPNAPQLPAAGQTGQQQPAQPPAPKGKKYMGANGIYQPDNLAAQLDDLAAKGVQYVTWIAGKNTCDLCLQNNGVTRLVGQPFPSGHILPQAHPNCDCQVIPAAKTIDLDLLVKTFAAYLLALEQEKKSHDFNDKNVVSAVGAGLQLRNMSVSSTPQGAQDWDPNKQREGYSGVSQRNTNLSAVTPAGNDLKSFLKYYNL